MVLLLRTKKVRQPKIKITYCKIYEQQQYLYNRPENHVIL